MKEQIAEVVGFELNDPTLESVVVTEVKVAPDLRDAKVFVFISGSDKEIDRALRSLRNASTFVRQQVAMNLDLRHAPHVHFVRDTAEENAARIGEIINDLSQKGEFEKDGKSDE